MFDPSHWGLSDFSYVDYIFCTLPLKMSASTSSSVTLKDIESVIASRFGEMKDGSGFSVDKIEHYVEKVQDHDQQRREKEHDLQKELLLKKRKPALVCRNATCRNSDEQDFEKDERVAQVTCKRCGFVLQERIVHDGEWQRQFEGEVNPTMHGPPPDPRFSTVYNLQTGVANVPGSTRQAKDIALAQKNVEMNLSNMRKGREGMTRDGYKDEMKRQFFEHLMEISDSMQLHRNILARAQTLFGHLRDDTPQLNNRFEHAAACLILACREKQKSGGELLAASRSNGRSAARNETKPTGPVFLCKYCNMDFSLKRDKSEHQKYCQKKPAEEGDDLLKRQRLG